ncbi:cytochrome P450 [Amylocystis lapponica]|nr:cytochrome P450 [Amylocystis lapponica]
MSYRHQFAHLLGTRAWLRVIRAVFPAYILPQAVMVALSYPLLTLTLGLAAWVVFALRTRRSRLPLPPGPPGVPITGNLLQVDPLRLYPKASLPRVPPRFPAHPDTQFQEWAKKYGEIFSLRFGAQTIIVLNTPEAAHELFVNRGVKYASRAPPHVAQDVMSVGQRMVFLKYGPEWKASRKSFQSAIGPAASKGLRRFQDLESRVLLHDLMLHGDKSIIEPQASGDEVPDGHWFALVRRYTLSLVMNAIYGKRINKVHDNLPLKKVFDVMANLVCELQPGRYLADVFPVLRYLPDFLAPWRVNARKMHDWEMELYGGLLDESNAAPRARGYVPQYLRARSEAGHEHAPGVGLTEDGWMRDLLVAYNAGTALEAGADTTAGALLSAIMFFLMHPAVLERARAEVDAAVGDSRLPEFADEAKMPYIVACAKETLRRRPPIIMGVPHAVLEDDVYKGYFIPKDAMVMGNVWAMQMDETRFPDPTAFVPERFLDEDNPREHWVFGWGRRNCQGRNMAEASLFLVLARILWGLDFHAPRLPDPNDESRKGTWTDGMGRRELVTASYEETQREWEAMGLEVDPIQWTGKLHGAVLLPYTPSSDSGNRPQWAKSIKTRRGVDPPFIAPKKTSSLDKLCSYSGWSSSTARAPQSLPQVHTREHGSQYVEIEMRSSPVLPEIITPLQGQPLSYGLFPDCVVDPDAPIRKYSVSRLVTADNSWCSERRLPPRMPPRTPPRTSI